MFISFAGGSPNGAGRYQPGNGFLFGLSIFLYIIAGIPLLISWIGALIKMAQLQRWGWFICLLLFQSIALLLYVFIGPETPAYKAQPFQQ
jgi:hypothetical protein